MSISPFRRQKLKTALVVVGLLFGLLYVIGSTWKVINYPDADVEEASPAR